MKKHIYILMGFATLIASVSCQKEQETKQESEKVVGKENPEVLPANIPAAITASIADTKTSYDEKGKFSWTTGESGDIIYLMFYNTSSSSQGWIKYQATSAEESGKAVFTIVPNQGDKITAIDGFINSGVAIYGKGANSGKTVARPNPGYDTGAYNIIYDHHNEYAASTDPFITLQSELTGDSSEVVMIGTGTGTADEETGTYNDFQFYTACAVLRVTVTGIPAEAKELRLCTNDMVNYPLSGDFIVRYIKTPSGTPEITVNDYRKWKQGNEYKDSSSEYIKASVSGSSNQTFYFNVPTGSYPPGTLSLKLVDTDDNNLLSKAINTSVTFSRNEEMDVEFANQWTTLGKGKFYNKQVTDGTGSSTDGNYNKYYHADVVIQQNVSNTDQYRVINPYGAYWTANSVTPAYTPDKYLTFTVDLTTDRVTAYADHYIGHNLDDSSGNVFIRYKDTAKNKVWQKADGKPLVVQLAPLFRYNNDSAGWDKSSADHIIEILFPGYDTSAELKGKSAASDNNLILTVVGPNVSQFSLNISNNSGSEALAYMGTTKYDSESGNGSGYGGYNVTGFWTRHFSYKTYNTDGTEIGLGTFENVKIYSITTEDAAKICSQYLRNPATNTGVTDISEMPSEDTFALNGATTLTIAVSNDPTKGNLMIPEFLGYNYIVDNSSMPHADFENGTPLYGTCTSGASSASFKVVSTPFCTASDGNEYRVSTVTSGNSAIDFDFRTAVSDVTYDLVYKMRTNDNQKWLGLVYGDAWGSNGKYVHYYTSENNPFVADKTKGMIPLTVDMLDAFSTLTSANQSDRKGGLAGLINKKSGFGNGNASWWCDYNATSTKTHDTQGIWIQIDLGGSKTVNEFTLKFRTTYESHGSPTKYRIAVSKDGDSWSFVTDEISIGYHINTWHQKRVDAGDDYRYVRLCLTEAYFNGVTNSLLDKTISGSSSGIDGLIYVNLDEIQLWEN